tara:strand:+ start:178 stop:1443 length:1266 start_codon:yes stop_codon:yes gene_type:complete
MSYKDNRKRLRDSRNTGIPENQKKFFSGAKRVIGGYYDTLSRGLTDFDQKGKGGLNLFNPISGGKDKRWGPENNFVEEQKEKAVKKNKEKSSTALPTERLKRTYRDRGGVLRYPFEALTERTDYLQIDIAQYESVRSRTERNTIVGRTNRVSPLRGRNPFGLTTKSLVNKGTILLQIPSQIEDGNAVNYGGSSLNSIAGAAISGGVGLMEGAGQALSGDFGEGTTKAEESLKSALKAADVDVETGISLLTNQLAVSAVNVFGGNVSINQVLARQEGQVFNPNMELLFNGPTLRNFRFAFKMTPRSPEEAEQCKLIIRTFKMNMAPKITSGRSGSSLFLNTPNVFELRYKSGVANHPFLHRFKQCFLTDMSVNYTGEGVYATYEGREPVSMIMNLTFKELEPIYDQDYFDAGGFDADDTVGF